MILIADAAPVIFLAKINQLALVHELFKAEIIGPSAINDEILDPGIPADEERSIRNFLVKCKVIHLEDPEIFAQSLSQADNCVLTLAHREKADIILSDDRLLRKVADMEGFRVTGTLGILLRGINRSLLSPKKAADLPDQLVEEHHFRISIKVYQAARKAIAAIK